MAVYKFTHMWNQSVMGVSETWLTRNVSPGSLNTVINQFLQARYALMFDNQFPVGLRISTYPSVDRQSFLIIPPSGSPPFAAGVINLPQNGFNKSGQGPYQPDLLRVAAQLRVSFGTNRQANRYLAGVPDANTYTDPSTIANTGFPAWTNALVAFIAFAEANLQIEAIADSTVNPPGAIIGIVNAAAAPTQVGIVVSSATAPNIRQGDRVMVQKLRPAKGTRNPTMNGQWTVDSVNTTLQPGNTVFFLRNSESITASTQRITTASTIRKYSKQAYSVTSVELVRYLTHKRGRPSIAPRGRRLSRPTLDP